MTTGCGAWREYVSADLDGETGMFADEPPGLVADAYQHMAGCAACADWFAQVTRVNRLIRTGTAAPGPGLSEDALAHVLDQLPRPSSPHRRLWRGGARAALGLVGTVQALLGGLPLVLPDAAAFDPHAAMMNSGMMGAGMIHMSHEYSSWNLALGISFVVGALWTRHLAGTLPVLASFVAVLLGVSAVDLLDGEVDAARVASHVLVVLGLGLVVVIVRTGAVEPTSGPSARQRPRWRPAPVEPLGSDLRPDLGHGLGRAAERGGPNPAAHSGASHVADPARPGTRRGAA